ncbi:MAG: ROK family protein [Rhodoglobus sp.]
MMRGGSLVGPGAILGIDFGGTKVALRVDAAGAALAGDRILIEAGERALDVVDRTVVAARRLLDHCGAPVDAVGIATPGIVHDDRIELAPNVAGWSDISLRERMVEGLGIPRVFVGNDVKAAALAEVTTGALVGMSSGLYLNLGTGIAAAMVMNGVVVEGAHGASGEIGYALVGAPSAIDWTGKGAPLEELMGGRGLGKRGSYQFGTDGSARAILDLARQDARAADFVRAGFDELARHVLTCVLLLDPQRVVIGGGMSRASDLLLDPLRARLNAVLAFPPEIVHSSFGADASLLGAIELARRGVAGTRSPLQTSSQAP